MDVERPVEFLNLLNSNRTYLPKTFNAFFFFFPRKCLSASSGGKGSNHEHFSERETACVKGFVGQRGKESAGVGGPREEYRQISRERIIGASWEGGGREGGRVREGVRQMEGLAV